MFFSHQNFNSSLYSLFRPLLNCYTCCIGMDLKVFMQVAFKCCLHKYDVHLTRAHIHFSEVVPSSVSWCTTDVCNTG